MGSTAAFMLTGPSTKITNLGAVKIVLGVKRFALYLAFAMAFSLMCGLIVDFILIGEFGINIGSNYLKLRANISPAILVFYHCTHV